MLNNAYLDWSPERRFGVLNRYHRLLATLPRPWDRLVDNLTGTRDRRLVVAGRLRVAGLVTVRGAQLLTLYLLIVSLLCAAALWRARSTRLRLSPSPP